MAEGRWIDPRLGRQPFGEFAEEWIRTRKLSERTRVLYLGLWRNHLAPPFGCVPIRRITPAMVRAWHAEALTVTGAVTVAKAYRLLRTILNTAVSDRLIAENPAQVDGGGIESSPERPVATFEQVLMLADAIEPRLSTFVLAGAFSGCRFGELAGLARRHVNLLHGSLHIERSLSELPGRFVFTEPKSKAGRRTVLMPGYLVAAFEAHLDTYVAADPEAMVFTGPKGGWMRRANFAPKFRAAADAVGLPKEFVQHDLRHTQMTLAAWSGAPLADLMARLGHSSVRAALRYMHATDNRQRFIVTTMDEAIAKARNGDAEDRRMG